MIVVILLIATAVMPNVLSMQRSREERSFWGRFERLPQRAREEAISRAQTIALRASDGERALELVTVSNNAGALEEEAEGSSVFSLPMLENATVQAMQQNGEPVTAGEFEIRFYPDGTSDSGGVTVEIEDLVQSLTIDKRGRGYVAQGGIDEQQDDSAWPAGEIEQRGK